MSGSPFPHGNIISAAAINRKTITPTTDLNSETPLPGQLFFNLINNSGFLANSMVARNAANNGWVLITQGKHYHDADTDESGGDFVTIFARSITRAVIYNQQIGLSPSDFVQTGSGGSTSMNGTTGAMHLATSTSSNNWRNSRLTGVRPGFAFPMFVQTKMQFVGNVTNFFVRHGINMESMDATNDETRKFGIESCVATNSNWFIISADNTTRSQSDSSKPVLGGGSVQSYRLQNNPGVSIAFTYATDSAVLKTTNLPTTSAPPQNNIVTYGVKTTDANEKVLRVWGLAFIGSEADASWA